MEARTVDVKVVSDVCWLISNKNNVSRIERFHNIVTPHIIFAFLMIIVYRCMGDELMICLQNSYDISNWNNFIYNYCTFMPKNSVCKHKLQVIFHRNTL